MEFVFALTIVAMKGPDGVTAASSAPMSSAVSKGSIVTGCGIRLVRVVVVVVMHVVYIQVSILLQFVIDLRFATKPWEYKN